MLSAVWELEDIPGILWQRATAVRTWPPPNLEYTLHVTGIATGRSRSYFNRLGESSPATTDTDAFATCL
jgi:hypothetical protein